MRNNYLICNDSIDPCYNLALEEFLLKTYTEGTVAMLWQNDKTIVIGRHQNALEEINQQYVKKHGINVVRRNTGGGAVYHDLGNLNYSFIADCQDTADRGMGIYIGYIVEALKAICIQAEFFGRNDILVEGRKVSGTAQRLEKNRILHHGCLLYDTDLSCLAQCLKVRPEKFSSKAVKSVRSRVANITDFLKEELSLPEFKNLLIQTICKEGKYQSHRLSSEEKRQVMHLRNEKYASWEWTYGSPIACTVHNVRRFGGGIAEVYLEIKDARIRRCQIYGDFMALRSVSDIEEAFAGCRYRMEDIAGVIGKFPADVYFGSITQEEILELFMGETGL